MGGDFNCPLNPIVDKRGGNLIPRQSDDGFVEEMNHLMPIWVQEGAMDLGDFCSIWDCRPVSSVGRAPDCCAGGRRFKPWPNQHSGSLNNWVFVMTPANG